MFFKPKRLEAKPETKLSQMCFKALNHSSQRLFNRLYEVLSKEMGYKIVL